MSKEVYYFSHDSNARQDPKISAMRTDFGSEGYGWFWIIIEMLRETEFYKLPCKKYIWNALAMQMQCKSDASEIYVNKCINDYELFETDGDFFWSNSLISRMDKKSDVSQKRREAANKRWSDANAMQKNANAMQTDAIKVKEKESKVKEKDTIFTNINIEERESKFMSELEFYKNDFPIEMIKAFFLYWSEKTTNGKKMRFENEKTWELGKRLSKWQSNNFNRNTNGKSKISASDMAAAFTEKFT